MYLGRVVGCVWSTVKHPGFTGMRMLIVQPLTPELRNTGKPLVCTDCTGAGAGEMVYWVRGKEASFPFLPAEPPTDTTIVGIVDTVHLKPVGSAELAASEGGPPKERGASAGGPPARNRTATVRERPVSSPNEPKHQPNPIHSPARKKAKPC